jgi:hypothetical protein
VEFTVKIKKDIQQKLEKKSAQISTSNGKSNTRRIQSTMHWLYPFFYTGAKFGPFEKRIKKH